MYEKYEPKLRKDRFRKFVNIFIAAAVAGLWFCRERFELDESVLFVLSGVALMIILLSAQNRKKEVDNYLTAKSLQEMREKMDEPHYYDE